MKNYFAVYQVNPNASAQELSDFFKKELRKWTMRANSPKKEIRDEAEAKIKEISEALDHFKDEASKAAYLQALNLNNRPQQQNPTPQPQPRPQPRPQVNPQGQGQPNTNQMVENLILQAKSLRGVNDAQAVNLLTQAINLNPRHRAAWLNLGNQYLSMYKVGPQGVEVNLNQEAENAYRKVFEFSPRDVLAAFNLFNYYRNWNRRDQQKQMFDILYPQIKDKTSKPAFLYRGLMSLDQGNYEDAVNCLGEVYKHGPEIREMTIETTGNPPSFYSTTYYNVKRNLARAYRGRAEDFKVYGELISPEDADSYIYYMTKAKQVESRDTDTANIESAQRLKTKKDFNKLKVFGLAFLAWALSESLLIGIILGVFLYITDSTPGYVKNRKALYKAHPDLKGIQSRADFDAKRLGNRS